MEIKELKIGDVLYTFESRLSNKTKPFMDYKFHTIKKETKSYWITSWHHFRKTDLKIYGEPVYGHVMTDADWETKRLKEEYQKHNKV